MKTNQKKFNRKDVKVGLKAVVNDLPDTQIYTVEAVHKFSVQLSYMAGPNKLDAGWIDYDSLRQPTPEQLKANGL